MSLSDQSCGIRPDEQLCDLQLNGLKIIQKQNGFRFGTDAVLLSDFTKVRKKDRVVDFGTGTGIIALLLCGHHPEITVEAVEIQEESAEMAARSVEMNALGERIKVHNMDIKDAPASLGRTAYDVVVCNPPYYDAGAGAVSSNESRLIARTETTITIDEICRCASVMLKSGGRLSVVYPARYLFNLMTAMKSSSLAPKRVRMVHADSFHAPKIVLIDAIKHGGDQLDWLPPLMLKNEDGSYSDEWHRIYG